MKPQLHIAIVFILCLLLSSNTYPAASSRGTALSDPLTYFNYLPIVMGGDGVCLSGVVFHDMNGNGVQDQAYRLGDLSDHPDGWLGAVGPITEPAIAGASISIGTITTTSTIDGRYSVCLPPGHYEVTIEKAPYRFWFPSDREVKELSKSLYVDISGNQTLDFGLGVGLFTMPYSLDVRDNVRFEMFTDIDPESGEVGIYNAYPCSAWYCYDDGHRGIDYQIPADSYAVALAPGFIYSVGYADDGSLMIVEAYTDYEGLAPWTGDDRIHWPGRGIQSSYQHLDRAVDGIEPGVFVRRGQPLAYINSHNHLHIDVQLGNWDTGGYLDVYRDTFHSELEFLYHENGPSKISQGSPGYWTVDNQPYFFNADEYPSLPLRTPENGDNATAWGWRGSIQIWGNREGYDCHNTGVIDFICDAGTDPVSGLPISETGRTLHEWDNDAPMEFAGQIPLGDKPQTLTVYFESPVLNVLITSGPSDLVHIDRIVGITPEGIRIPIGYTIDDNGLVRAPLFYDGYSSGAGTYLEAERNMVAPPVCGMVGVDIDQSYMEHGGMRKSNADGTYEDVGSFILFRLPKSPASELTNTDLWAARGSNVHEIAAVEITALIDNNSPPPNICP